MTKEIIARLESHGQTFEFFVDASKIQDYKKGNATVDEVVIGDAVFSDVRKAERQIEEQIKGVFGTTDFRQVAEKILKDGEIQLTVEQRREMQEAKMRKIVDYISKRAYDPKAQTPHPPQRIENALEQVKFRVEPFESAESQVKSAIEKLKSVLPISIESKKVEMRIPVKFAGACKNIIQKECTIVNDSWVGSHWSVTAEVPAGMIDTLFSKLNGITSGELVAEIVR